MLINWRQSKGARKMKNFDDLPEQIIDIKDKPRPATDFLNDYYQSLGNGESELLGISTGFKALDKATLGLDGLIVLGGIAGQGKTSLALQLACNACDTGTPTIFYSLEMPRRAILTKLLNRIAKVKYSDILLKGKKYLTKDETGQAEQTGQDRKLLSEREAENLKAGKEALKAIGTEFYIRSRERGEAEINFSTVEQEIEYLKALHSKQRILVVIDHLQVFNVDDYKDQIDKEGKLITGFKVITERTGATIVLISQKNKQGFTSKGLQTLKGSVDIVYLADIVMTLESKQEAEGNNIYDNQTKEIDLIIQKNRYNAPTTIKLELNGEYSEFTEKN